MLHEPITSKAMLITRRSLDPNMRRYCSSSAILIEPRAQ